MKKIKKKKTDDITFLDDEERELYDSLERDEWKSVSKKEKIKDIVEFKVAAKNTFRQSKPITLRVNENDLLKLKARALEQGLPYQTLLISIIHRYANRHNINKQKRKKVPKVVK